MNHAEYVLDRFPLDGRSSSGVRLDYPIRSPNLHVTFILQLQTQPEIVVSPVPEVIKSPLSPKLQGIKSSYYRPPKHFRDMALQSFLESWGVVVCSTRGRRNVCLAWLALSIVGGIFGVGFPSSTNSEMPPPKNSRANKANEAKDASFPQMHGVTRLLFLLQCSNDGFNAPMSSCCSSSTSTINMQQCGTHLRQLHRVIDAEASAFPEYIGLDDYVSFADANLTLVANEYISSDRRAMIMLLNYRVSSGMALPSWFRRDSTRARLKAAVPSSLSVILTGKDILLRDVVDSSTADMVRVDSVSLPLALVIMALLVGNVLLLALPLAVLVTAVVVSFSLMSGVIYSGIINISSLAPPVMMSLCVALSIDYTLFFLVRFRSHIKERGDDVGRQLSSSELKSCIIVSHCQSGRVVIISGTTLACTFLLLCLFRVNVLQSLGIGAAVSIVCTMFSSITLLPALLFCLHRPIEHITNKFQSLFRRLQLGRSSSSMRDSPVGTSGQCSCLIAGQPSSSSTSAKSSCTCIEARQKRSLWFRAASWSTSIVGGFTVIGVSALVTSFLAYQASHLRHTTDALQIFPRESPAFHALRQVEASVGAGVAAPFYIVQQAPVFDHDAWVDQQLLVQQMVDSNMVSSDAIRSVTVSPPSSEPRVNLTPELSQQLLQLALQSGPTLQLVRAYAYMFSQLVNEDRSASIILVRPNEDPFSHTAVELARKIRALIDTRSGRFSYHLSSDICEQIDTVDIIYDSLPLCLACLATLLFVFMVIEFRSLLIPVRALVTISLSVSCVYGIGVMVFQGVMFKGRHVTAGLASWMFPSAFSDISAMIWLSPVLAFPVMIGLGLDYDIFLMERIYELRCKGFHDRTSILRAVYHTGSTISGAGVVMVVAFAGMMLSSSDGIAEIGFLLATAVLIDTFLVRTLLIPCLHHLGGAAVWWPGKVPQPCRGTDAAEPATLTGRNCGISSGGAFSDPNDMQPLVEQNSTSTPLLESSSL